MLAGSRAWLNINCRFSLGFYSEGDSGSLFYRALTRRQRLLIAFRTNKVTYCPTGQLKNEQI